MTVNSGENFPNSEGYENDLDSFPGVHMAIDLAIFTVGPTLKDHTRQLQLLLVKRPWGFRADEWVLPGQFVRERKTLAETARVCLREKAGITGFKTKQVVILDDPDRDPRGWTLSVGSLVAVPQSVAEAAVLADPTNRVLVTVDGTKIDLPSGQEELPFSQQVVVDQALNRMRSRYFRAPDPWKFLGERFTLTELKAVHDAVLGPNNFSRDSFRRTMSALLTPTGEFVSGSVGKPAELYARSGDVVTKADVITSAKALPRRLQTYSSSSISSSSKQKPSSDDLEF